MAVVNPLKTTDTSTSIPTEIKKMGINNEFPKNSIRFINADECGINLLRAKPAAKAPIIGSIPPNSAKNPQRNKMNNTKIKCRYFSPSAFWKNHLATRGIRKKTMPEKIISDNPNLNRNHKSNPPPVFDKISARMINTAVSVRMVPPTVMATAWFLATPSRLTMG